MLKKLVMKVKRVVASKQVAVGGGLMMLAGQAEAASMKESLQKLLCMVVGNGAGSSIVMFAGAAALICFLIMFTMGEGKDNLSTLMKIAIGISGLIALPTLADSIFGLGLASACATYQSIVI